jgi:hypothetical protein
MPALRQECKEKNDEHSMALAAGSFKTLTVRSEKAVLLVEISAPPMNLLGPELVRDLVSLIQHAEADSALYKFKGMRYV